jgi:hypothetical protein
MSFGRFRARARCGDSKIGYRQDVPPSLERTLYQSVTRTIEAVAMRVKVIQSGSVNYWEVP